MRKGDTSRLQTAMRLQKEHAVTRQVGCYQAGGLLSGECDN